MSKGTKSDIAIVGMSCWYPGAKTLVQFWENILAKRQEFRQILDSRLPLSEYYSSDRSTPDKTYGSRAAYVDGFDFDWISEKFPKSLYDSTDPVHWFAVDVVSKALADAGMERKTVVRAKTGVILGNSLTGEISRANGLRLRWPYVRKVLLKSIQGRGLTGPEIEEFLTSTEKLFKSVLAPLTADSLAGQMANTIAGRVCNYFNFDGGGFTVDGACSSSLLAVANAATSLSNGDLDMAIAGGVDVSLDTFELIGFAKVGALTPNEMRVYDRNGNGFIGGEGCGIIVMKRLEDAIRDGNKVYALLKGWGISSDGSGGITTPKATGQATALKRAYDRAGYAPSTCDFIEGHGTGTTVGDKIELEGISIAISDLGGGAPKSVGMTSLKSIIGHTKAAAGIGALIKAVIGVNRRILPPLAGCQDPNPIFQGAALSLFPLVNGEIKDQEQVLRAGVSAMGFGGINSHVTVESYGPPHSEFAPNIEERALLASGDDTEIFLFTAQTIESLKHQIEDYIGEASLLAIGELPDISAEICRKMVPTMPYRASFVASSVAEYHQRLQELLVMLANTPPKTSEVINAPGNTIWLSNKKLKPKVGFLFPGQGSQKINMSKKLVERFPWARELTKDADQIFYKKMNFNLTDCIFRPLHKSKNQEETDEWNRTLTQTEVAQPALCYSSILWAKRLSEIGITADLVGGHSLGELSALYWAGAYDHVKLFELATERGYQMASKSEEAGSMLSLECSLDVAEQLVAELRQPFVRFGSAQQNGAAAFKMSELESDLVIANVNGKRQTIISGSAEKILAAKNAANGRNIRSVQLNVSNAFHSPFVSEAASRFAAGINVLFNNPPLTLPFVSGLDGELHHQIHNLKGYLTKQITSSVQFTKVLERFEKECDLIVEVGSGAVLTGLANNFYGTERTKAVSVESRPGRDGDIARLIGQYFAFGGPVNIEKIFSNRLIRPYTSFSQKTFFVNPCENPFPDTVLSSISPAKKFSIAENRQEVESIGEHVPLRQTTNSSNQMTISLVATQHSSTPAQANGEQKLGPEEVRAILIETLTQVTGFPKDVFNMNMRLLDDLNLDSIKAGEVITQVSTKCSLQTQLDPIQISNSNLGEIVEIIAALSPACANSEPVRTAMQPTQTVPNLVDETSPSLPAPPLTQSIEASVTVGSRDEIAKISIETLTQVTGFPKDVFSMNMRLLDDLNLDSIKAGEVITQVSTKCSLQTQLDPIQISNSNLGEIVEIIFNASHATSATSAILAEPTKAKAMETAQSVYLKAVIQMTSRQLGFPIETIAPEAQFIRDLNADEVGLEKIVRSVCQQFLLPATIDISTLTTTTLDRLAQIVENIHQTKLKKDLNQEASNSNSTVGPGRPAENWTRNYVISMTEKPRPAISDGHHGRFIDQWPNAKVLLIADTSRHGFSEFLLQGLLDAGASAVFMSIEEASKLEAQDIAEVSYFIYLFPEQTNYQLSEEERVKASIRRLHFLATVPNSFSKSRRYSTLATIQFGDGQFGYGEYLPSFDISGASSVLQTLMNERADLRIRCLEVSLASDMKTLLKNVLTELQSSDHFSMTGFGLDCKRFQPLIEVSFPIEYKSRNIEWSNEDLVLVTGGGKGITAECCLAFARRHGTRLAIVGSSPLPANGEQNELTRNLERFALSGVDYKYYSCDVANSSDLKKTIDQIHQQQGKITAVIHGAGKNLPRRLSQVSQEGAWSEIASKLMGAVNLVKWVPVENLKLFVGFTSITGLLGGLGVGWYGYSNEALNSYLLEYGRKNKRLSIVTLAYGLWDSVGMGVRLDSLKKLSAIGMTALAAEEGVQRFLDLTDMTPGCQQVCVTPRPYSNKILDLNARFDISNKRFLEGVNSYFPNVEVISRVRLSLDRDLYLKDHRYAGNYLFPTVFGLEAMAQVAAMIIGNDKFEKVVVENLELNSAISVNPDTGTEIEIFGLADENPPGSPGRAIKLGIRCESSKFERTHFAATFRVHCDISPEQASAPKPTSHLGIDVKKQVYGPLLFHGPLYQRIDNIYELNDQAVLYTSLKENEEANKKRSFSDRNSVLILGDPYFRDSILQGLQMVVTKTASLPVFCERVEIHSNKMSDQICFIQMRLKNIEDKKIHCSGFAMDSNGNVLEKWSKMQSVIVKDVPRNPSPGELVASGSSQRDDLESRIHQMAHISKVDMTQTLFKKISGLTTMPPGERRSIEQVLLIEVLSKHFKLDVDPAEVKLGWLASGKPSISGRYSNKKVSFSHSNEQCVCSISDFDVGCDVELVVEKDEKTWASLLGPVFGEVYESTIKKVKDQLSPSLVGTIIWSAREATLKAFDSKKFEMKISRIHENAITFVAHFNEKTLDVVSFVFKAGEADGFYVFSLASERIQNSVEASDMGALSDGFSEAYSLKVTGEKGVCARWPVTFKDASSAQRKVHFSKYFEWQGRLRELALLPMLSSASELFQTGKHGWVTNNSETRIFRAIEVGDVLEGRLTYGEPHGKAQSSVELFYNWYRVAGDSVDCLVAQSRMLTTWVKVVGHGVVDVAPFPADFTAFFSRIPKSIEPKNQFIASETEWPSIYQAPPGVATGPLLAETIYSTALEDSNLVGNIYFSNYSMWLGKTRDTYFHSLFPQLSSLNIGGELFCTQSNVNHLRELMPFEQVMVQMRLKSYSENGVKIYFEFFRCVENRKGEKIAYGDHSLIWANETRNELHSEPMPRHLLYVLRKAVREYENPTFIKKSS